MLQWVVGNIDVNVIGVLAYPLVASADALRRHGDYVDGTETTMALLVAPMMVVAWAELVFSALTFVTIVSRRPHSAWFPATVAIYFVYTSYLLNLRCCAAGWTSYINLVLPMPYHDLGRVDNNVCLANMGRYVGGADKALSMPMCPSSSAMWIAVLLEVVIKAMVISVGIFFLIDAWPKYRPGSWWTFTSDWNRDRVRYCFEAVRWLGCFYLLLLSIIGLVKAIVFLRKFGGSGMPPTKASILDLDQAAAMVVGGVLPLLFQIVHVLSRSPTQPPGLLQNYMKTR